MKINASLISFLVLSCSAIPNSRDIAIQAPGNSGDCPLTVPEPYRSGYADFTLVLSFSLGPGGAPVDLQILNNLPQIPWDEVKRCVKRWRFPSKLASENLLATFQWDHNRGWTQLRVTGSISGLIWEVDLAGRG